MARRRQENLEWEGVIGPLTSATIATNFEPETGKGVFIRGPVNFEFLAYC